MNNTLAIATTDNTQLPKAQALAEKLKLPICSANDQRYTFILTYTSEQLELCAPQQRNWNPIAVNFLTGSYHHRRQFGGGKNQLIAKAMGIKAKHRPNIIDTTAGLGRDGFVLASLGCTVTLIERSPIISALLTDGLERAKKDPWFNSLGITLIETDSIDYLSTLSKEQQPETIYCDPMFTATKKSALVKKEMRLLRILVGDDLDASDLLKTALCHTNKRVVVKRSLYAPFVSSKPPQQQLKGQRCRYDIYLPPNINSQ